MDLRVIHIVVVFLSSISISQAKVCPSGYTLSNNVCYKIVSSHHTWQGSKSYCQREYGNLISAHNPRLYQHLRSYSKRNKETLWLGANAPYGNRHFWWVDGTSCCSSWRSGEPNDSGGEDCVQLYYKNSDSDLNDEDCDAEFGFVCERKGCSDIAQCEKGYQTCTHSSNTCRQCEHNRYFFKLTNSDTKCERMCSWNSHYCWPGECNDQLTRGCSCATGFRKVSTSSETSCQLKSDNQPSLLTCETVVIGPNGEKKRAKSQTTSSKCEDFTDFFGNFQLSTVSTTVMAEFTIDVTSYHKPAFIKESNFGVTDVTLHLLLKDLKGRTISSDLQALKDDTSNGVNAERTFGKDFNITVDKTRFRMSNGQKICVQYEVKGGGYLKSKNTIDSSISSAVPYIKTTYSRELCYKFDNAAPEHCSQSGKCSKDPMSFIQRVTNLQHVYVHFDDWLDPAPHGGTAADSSGIESYQITLNEVLASSVPLKVDTTPLFTKKVNNTVTAMSLALTTDRPKLFCIVLEVKDVADNVRQARRFVLFDNTSIIQTDPSEEFIIESASAKTHHQWQTHHNDICLNWKDYFLNKVYIDNHFLGQIEPEPHGLISGVYEQNTGKLPVAGTENIHGIVKFEVSWQRNYDNRSAFEIVQHFKNQRFCHEYNVRDGETYNFIVKASDIAGHNKSENRTVYIDRSVPHINNIWLIKNGYRRLFVHGTKDLSEMQLYFEALDPHSGIQLIEWAFGTQDAGSELTTGSISVNTILQTCQPTQDTCYCPDIGLCEMYGYTLQLNKLIHINKQNGNHNRNYFFTLKITNHAMLTNIEHLDILVDDSPPAVGVILEGSIGGPEIDYTSSDTLSVHWHGFIDHESGIKLYRVAIAPTCLNKQVFKNISISKQIIEEVPYTVNAYSFSANFSGTWFTTIVALNNAMEMSEAVCSDGITRDESPPAIRNVSLVNAHWSESLACHKGSAWLFEDGISKLELHQTDSCRDRCSNETFEHAVASMLPTSETKFRDEEVSQFLCDHLDVYTAQKVIYLPHGNVYLSWGIDEMGSQIEDFYVGYGMDSTFPNLINYQSTNKHQYYTKHHPGIGSNRIFYIFIKAKNKASLETVSSIGPIIIDETPPISKEQPGVIVFADNVVIGWENDTFYDMEQKEPIDKIYFQFGYDSHMVTPMMEWQQSVSSECNTYTGGCIKYPVKRLQTQDTDLGHQFYASLYVYNRAGHFIVVKSNKFQIPSKYPPGQALVLDVDPENLKSVLEDADVHFVANTICAKWEGFKHHEHISIEFAVGTSPGNADVLPFVTINETYIHCEKSPALKSGVVYYVSLRASCSGGTSVSSSNGVTLLPEEFISQSLSVNFGESGTDTELQNVHFKDSNVSNSKPKSPLKVGRKYIIETENTMIPTIANADGLIEARSAKRIGVYLSLIPFVERPNLSFECLATCNNSYALKLSELHSPNFIRSRSTINVTLSYQFPSPPLVNYKILLLNYNTAGNISKTTEAIYRRGLKINSNMSFVEIPPTPIASGGLYKVEVSVCGPYSCVGRVQSDYLQFEVYPPTGKLIDAELHSSSERKCSFVHLTWKQFETDSSITLYQWGIYGSLKEEHMLTRWQSIIPNGTYYDIRSCIDIPVYSHKEMSVCLRAYSWTGMVGRYCKIIDLQTNGEYKQSAVYDLDSSSPNWSELIKVIPSNSIGDTTKLLHNAELDFGTVSSRVVGAIAYGSDRNISWYLMGKQNVPTICDSLSSCVYNEITSTGYIVIPPNYIEMNKLYYICALSNATEIKREFFTEKLEEIKECSNGFVLDDSPPSPGYVNVTNENGYLTDLSTVDIQWDDFEDNFDATTLGYIDSIQYYSYAIGSRPMGDDIRSYITVGLSKTALETRINSGNGSKVYVTVKATDYSGLTTTAVSKALVVDTTAPVAGDVVIDCVGTNTVICKSSNIQFHVEGFSDLESGIESFEVLVGSFCGMSNIASEKFTRKSGIIVLNPNDVNDGHTLCLIAKVKNRAGLASSSSSQRFRIDTSPPIGGQVLEGRKEAKMDIDYQEDITSINAHWRGFADIHSGIEYYRVGLGLRPYDDDIQPMTFVGLQTEISWNSTFIPGIRYFTTVEACNQAGLCRIQVSDGLVVDSSPPIRGLVTVGSESDHMKYLQKGFTVHIRWFGFEDPQSDIDHFDACIGTSSGYCDILPFFPCLLQSNVIKSGLNLTDLQNYYATVMAFNKVGKSVKQTSDAFRIDSTPPEVMSNPTFDTGQRSHRFLSQWERSVVTINWKFIDNESPISYHKVTLKTHHEGHTPVELLDVGTVSTVTIQLDKDKWLNNGDKYIAVITCCNAAGLCTTAESSGLLIDSTPPFLGGFKPPLSWNNINSNTSNVHSVVLLTWYGFHDEESDIDKYYITVSRSYSGQELSNGVFIVKENAKGLDEHQVNITLTEPIVPDDTIILTVWAKNIAGLNSSVARISVNALSTVYSNANTSSLMGVLEIEKHSCDIHFCNKDCTCAVLGQPCTDVISNMTCVTLYNETDRFSEIEVFGGLVGDNIEITASSICLTAHWVFTNESSDVTVERFEWSIGLLHQPVGEGVFDLKKTNPWNDVGIQKEIVYCLENDKSLIHDEQYSIYVKVWYLEDTSRIFTSKPVQIDHTSPHIRRGGTVFDSDVSCEQDYDYIDWIDGITGCWQNVFTEQQGEIQYYTVSLGTSPKADDVYPTTNVGIVKLKTVTNVSLHPGTKYYFTVTAYNNVGLHITLSSDGFVVDVDNPINGVVFNTNKHVDALYQYDVESFSISWHGFQDHFSGIHSYSVALVDDLNFLLKELVFKGVGVRTSYTFSNLQLKHGKSYYGLVKAFDAAGHVSNASISRGKTIDTTAPAAVICTEYIELEKVQMNLSDDQDTLIIGYTFTHNVVYTFQGTILSPHMTVRFTVGENSQLLPVVASDDGTYRFEYMMIPEKTSWLNISIQLDSPTNATGEITINMCENKELVNSSGLRVKQIRQSTITTYLPILDNESGIRKLNIGVGSTPDGFQIQELSPVHPSIMHTIDVQVPHNTTLYVTAIAENHAGLRSVFRSKPLVIDKSPPRVVGSTVLKAEMSDASNDSSSTVDLTVTWRIEDKESGVKLCSCGLGHYPGLADIRPFFKSDMIGSYTYMNVSVLHGDELFATVRCINHLELFTETSSQPVLISTEPPQHTNAKLKIVEMNANPKPNRKTHATIKLQSNQTCVQLEWHGFSDSSGIEEYEYRLLHDGRVEVGWTSAGKQTMARIPSLLLKPGHVYTGEVRALNSGRHVSNSASANIKIVPKPSLTGHPVKFYKTQSTASLDWSEVFRTEQGVPCLYDVTVGSQAGRNDVTDKAGLITSTLDVLLKTSLEFGTLDEIFVSVTCTLPTGAGNTYNTRVSIF